MLRYLTLLLDGGISLDKETKPMKAMSEWGNGAQLWRNGSDWLYTNDTRDEEGKGHKVLSVNDLGPPSMVVGIAIDAGSKREDWKSLSARPVRRIY